MRTESKVIFLSVIAGMFVWIADAVLDCFFFYKGPFVDLLILNVPLHEVYVRLVSMVAILILGLVAARLITKRKKVEEELRRAHHEWGGIFQAIGHPTVILDQDQNIIAANYATLRTTGRSEQELQGKKCYEIFHETDQAQEGCPLKTMLKSGHLETVEMEIQTLGGVFLVSCTPVFDDSGCLQKTIHIATNITEAKRAEEALRQERDFNRRLIQASPAFIVSISPDGRTLMMNDAMLQTLGYTEKEVAGKDYLSTFVPEADREMLADIFKRLVSSKEPTINENRVITKGGRELLVEWHGRQVFDVNGEVEYFFGVGIDITERKRVEEELRFTKFSIDHMTEAAFWIGPDARFIYTNEAACRSLGYTRDELLSMSVHDIDPNFPKETWPEHWRELKTRRFLTFESRHRTRDGRIFPVEITINYLEYNGREYNFAFARDITDRKRAEEAVRMAEVGKLASGLVHEVRNPLNAMRMQIAVIRNRFKRPHDGDMKTAITQLQRLEHEVLRVQQLANDFLAYGRPASDNPETIELSQVVSDVAEFVKPEFEQIGVHVDVTMGADAGRLSVRMDLSKLRQMLLNLAENARQAMTGGGMLKINCDKHSDQEVRIQVCDTGRGIPPEQLPRVFDVFYTTKDEGTGLGLAIVKRTVEAAGGHVEVESEVDHWTRFEIYLPLATEAPPAQAGAEREGNS
jgi:PAS domain S-box-containing protein